MRLNFNILFYFSMYCSSVALCHAANTQDHYDFSSGGVELDGNLLIYTGSAPASILIEGDGSTVVNGNEFQGFQFVDLTNPSIITVKNIAEFKNFTDSTDGEKTTADGGAVFYVGKNATLNFEGYSKDNKLNFNGSYSESDGNHAEGTAISVNDGGVVGDIYADFSNNKAVYPKGLTDIETSTYSRGAAINVAGSTNSGTMGNVYGTFTNNIAEYGGAVYIGEDGVIGTIEGVFKSNHAESAFKPSSYTGASAGGAIRFLKSTMTAIKGEFIGNTVHALAGGSTSTAQGGAIALFGAKFADEKGSIQGRFEQNISFSESAQGLGGAFHLKSQTENAPLYITDSIIKGNIAGTANVNSDALGGAFYIELSDHVFLDARNTDFLIRDNYEIVGGAWDPDTHTVSGGTRDYNAIYAKASTIHLRAQNSSATVDGEEVITGHKITIDDSIESADGSNLILDSSSSQRYDVEINAEIRNMDVTVKQGGLILGSYEHKYTENSVDYSVTTTGSFVGGTLTITKDGLVNTMAENISTATSITNAGLIEFQGGSLTQNINITGTQTGDLAVLGEMSVSTGQRIYADTIIMDDTLNIAANATVDVKTLLYEGRDMYEINASEQIVLTPLTSLDFDTVSLHIDTAMIDDIFDLIISDGSGNVNSSFDQSYDVEFYLAGSLLTRDIHYVVEEPDANGGLRIRFLIPEPSTATLSVLALAGLLLRRRRSFV